jgi:hypothetical protein
MLAAIEARAAEQRPADAAALDARGRALSPAVDRFRRGSLARLEVRRTRRRADESVLQHIANEVLAAQAGRFPVDLARLASHLGVDAVRVVPLTMRGRLVLDAGKLVVEVNEELDQWDRRRVIAHELSHAIIERDRLRLAKLAGRNVERDWSHSRIERLCDAGADELLLPERWLQGKLASESASLETAMRIADQGRLPLEFVVARVIALDLGPWRALVFARGVEGCAAVRSVPAVSAGFLCSFELVDVERSPVGQAEQGAVTSGRVALRVDGEATEYRAHCTCLSDQELLCVLGV